LLYSRISRGYTCRLIHLGPFTNPKLLSSREIGPRPTGGKHSYQRCSQPHGRFDLNGELRGGVTVRPTREVAQWLEGRAWTAMRYVLRGSQRRFSKGRGGRSRSARVWDQPAWSAETRKSGRIGQNYGVERSVSTASRILRRNARTGALLPSAIDPFAISGVS